MSYTEFVPYEHRSKNDLISEIRKLRKELSEYKDTTPKYDSVYDAAFDVIKRHFPAYTKERMLQKGRVRENVIPRQIFCYLLCRFTTLSLKAVGRYLDKDHSTVIHGRNTVEDICTYDKQFANMIGRMSGEFKKVLTVNNL